MTEVVLFVAAAPFGLFLIALLFLVAGLLTPSSFERKGARRFVVDRLLRLGVPFALYVLLVQPALMYALRHPLGAAPGSFSHRGCRGPRATARHRAAVVRRRPARVLPGLRRLEGRAVPVARHELARSTGSPRSPGPPRSPGSGRDGRHGLTVRTLALVALLVAPASFAVRLLYPYGSESGVSDLNFWEWPACVAVFGLGTAAAHRGWITAVPEPLVRRCRAMTLAGALAMAALSTGAGLRGSIDDALGGPHGAAAGFALIDAVLTVFGSVWLLGVAQHRLDRRYRHGPALSRERLRRLHAADPVPPRVRGRAAPARPPGGGQGARRGGGLGRGVRSAPPGCSSPGSRESPGSCEPRDAVVPGRRAAGPGWRCAARSGLAATAPPAVGPRVRGWRPH